MMDTGISEDEVEGVEPVEQLYGLFAGEDFLTDLEIEHQQEVVRDERIRRRLAILDAEKIRDSPPDPLHPRSVSSSNSSESDE